MNILRYRDTRGLDPARPPFSEVVMKGIAEGGGLYVPESLPSIGVDDIAALAALPYHERAAAIFRLFAVDIPDERAATLLKEAYSSFDHPAVAPVVTVMEGMHVLELWHGPTSAFKDMALQCMPLFFSESIAMAKRSGTDREYLILVATSGDTGKAALEGFADRGHTKIAVFYPADGVSDLQRLQMVTQRGGNVAVFGAHGNFDDCQNAVKAAFSDNSFNDELSRRKIVLSSANSINWGRLLPQVVYYLSAYADMVSTGAVEKGAPIDVCVPTGNFGNILGAWYARKIGTPIGRLICASNENNVLTDFIDSGTYDISHRPFVKTPSPSMDILVSSNLERLLFEICGDGEKVGGWIADLAAKRRFTVDDGTFDVIRKDFIAGCTTNNASLEAIRSVFAEKGYLLDPHTSVAWDVGRRLKGKNPLLVVATAHWAKFGVDVYRALKGIPAGERLPGEAGSLGGVDLLEEIRAMAPGQQVPKGLSELADLEERFNDTVEGSKEGVVEALRTWLSEQVI